jgi:hypothetical protein
MRNTKRSFVKVSTEPTCGRWATARLVSGNNTPLLVWPTVDRNRIKFIGVGTSPPPLGKRPPVRGWPGLSVGPLAKRLANGGITRKPGWGENRPGGRLFSCLSRGKPRKASWPTAWRSGQEVIRQLFWRADGGLSAFPAIRVHFFGLPPIPCLGGRGSKRVNHCQSREGVFCPWLAGVVPPTRGG